MSRDIQPAMLILSRAIYAKRADETYYAGSVETKLPNGCYLVKFADGCSETVEEYNITWLGFWGLPSSTWPRNPVIQAAGAANWDARDGQRTNNGKESSNLTTTPLMTVSHESRKIVNVETGMYDVSFGLAGNLNESSRGQMICEQCPAHVLPRQTSPNQARLSVLRMCCNGNLNQEHDKVKEELSTTATDGYLEQAVFKPASRSTSPVREEKNELAFDERKRFTQNVKNEENDCSFRKRKLSSFEYGEFLMNEKCSRSEHFEDDLRDHLPFHKHYPFPTALSYPHDHHAQNYGYPFDVSVYDSNSPPIPTSFRLETRARRRTENKKCRKVYGVENRDIWCTQCKWKKACTRFSTTEKGAGQTMVHMPKFEELNYPF